jgi:hypothetical protein
MRFVQAGRGTVNEHQQALAPIEQSLLQHVETLRNTLVAGATEANKDQTAERCLAMTAHCHHNLDAYIGLLPTAQLFSAAGLPRLAVRLAEVIAEAQNSSNLWSAAVANALLKNAAASAPAGPSAAELAQRAQQDRYAAMREAQQAQFDAWQAAHARQQAAFDAQNARWSENFNKS